MRKIALWLALSAMAGCAARSLQLPNGAPCRPRAGVPVTWAARQIPQLFDPFMDCSNGGPTAAVAPGSAPTPAAGLPAISGTMLGDLGPGSAARSMLDWNWTPPGASASYPPGAVTGTPAVWLADASHTSADAMYVATDTTRTPNFFKLNNLYAATPSIGWTTSNGFGLDGSSVNLSLDGTMVYALDSQGSLFCYDAVSGGNCANWSSAAVTTGNGASLSSPWVDYTGSQAIYFGDLAGYLHRVDAKTGAAAWNGGVNLNGYLPWTVPTGGRSNYGIRSSPIVYNGYIYVGNDAGVFYRIKDDANVSNLVIDKVALCASPSSSTGCGAPWAIVNGATLDTAARRLYVGAAGVLFEFTPVTGTPPAWGANFKQELVSGGGSYPMYSSPIVDYNNQYIYAGYNNSLYKVQYPFTSNNGNASYSVALYKPGSDGSYPHSSPLTYNGHVYIGDGGGYGEQLGCVTSSAAPSIYEITPQQYGTEVDTSPVIDYLNGNINFGYTSSSGGGLVQITQQSWSSCGTGSYCSTGGCGSEGACIPAGGCCTSAMCGSHSSCGGSHTCVCDSGYFLCGTTCLVNGTCCTSPDNCTAPKVCPANGGGCSSSASNKITVTFIVPAGAGIQSLVATLGGSGPSEPQTSTIACTGSTCSTIFYVANGIYSVSANAYDGSSGSGRVQAANLNANLLDISSADAIAGITLVRVYPVSTNGTDATCPLNLAIDSNGNIWTANGNGLSGSNCASPTNNLTKLDASNGYATTVINNPAISASPEFIATDSNGYVWVTVPSLQKGIFKLDQNGNVQPGFPIGSTCVEPRGITTDSTGDAYIACYGSSSSGGQVVEIAPNGSLVTSISLSDQPVNIGFNPNEYPVSPSTQGIYINRSSLTSGLIARMPSNLGSVDSYTASQTYDSNPYGITFDGWGTEYSLSQSDGKIINVGWTGSALTFYSANQITTETPFGIAADDQYSNWSNIWVTLSSTNLVGAYNNEPQTLLNTYVVGSSLTSHPHGIVFDSATASLWVSNTGDGNLSRISKRLLLLETDRLKGTPSSCPSTVNAGSTLTLNGAGFDSTDANNTVLVAGYLAKIKSASTTKIVAYAPSAPSGVTGPITVTNSNGTVQSVCTYTTK